MLAALAIRTLRTADARCLWKFAWNFGVKGMLSVEKFKRRMKRGEYFPPFLYVSIINSCNLRCQGCWVDVEAPRESIDLAAMNRLIADAKAHGNVFFGILGGEPFMHPELLEILTAHPDCYFQVFTNGQFITEKVAAELRQLGNVTPLVSIEGREMVSDERRGKRDVFNKTIRGLENCLKNRILTGVATSVCQTNIDELLTESWLQELIDRGVHYVWYHTYRPVGPKMNAALALRPDQLVRVREFVVEMRARMPIAIIDAYYDHDGRALCPMSTGISHHISPRGDIEPCPIIQFATETIGDERGVFATMRDSAFLKDFRELSARATRGCVVLERPDLVKELVLKHGARDTTLRGTAMAELDAMQPRFSQWLPGREVPEKHWMYRVAKKYWFSDFGAYRNARHAVQEKRLKLETSLDGGSAPLDTPAAEANCSIARPTH
ncbi:MAG: radical SAM protein [Verrucomicrobia subdivision 3 bacterium]|nr:radical SAM protein [Limisphaerales bacterium]